MSLPSLDEVLPDDLAKRPHLLLGNGFSIGWDRTAFAYGSLLNKAVFDDLSVDGHALFGALRTTDFEVAIDRLEGAAAIAGVYGAREAGIERLRADANALRTALADALAAGHPPNVGAISTGQYRTVRAFLGRFDRIFTVNYDLLLYWATMQDIADLPVSSNDGFGETESSVGTGWVCWDTGNNAHYQRIHYLHGALHLYDAGTELRKLTWARTGVPLVEQIRGQLEQRAYPLVVTEGTSDSKLRRILHSAYLSKALRSLRGISGTLVVFGHSLAESDDHILDTIVASKIDRLLVSVYGNPDDPAARAVIDRAAALAAERDAARKGRGAELEVVCFDAGSTKVW